MELKSIKLEKILAAKNVADLLDEEDLKCIGAHVKEGLEADLKSREQWEETLIPAIETAMQITEKKTSPWDGASNVKIPMITIGALQYHVKAYDALMGSNDLVRVVSYGEDPDGSVMDAAMRISQHMSYQMLEEDDCWEDETDKVLFVQGLIGCSFKKRFFDPIEKKQQSVYVAPWDLVVDYHARSIKNASRVTHLLTMEKNTLYERERAGLFLSCAGLSDDDGFGNSVVDDLKERLFGSPSTELEDAPLRIAEMHCYLDLDGDGYKEPYIVTFHRHTGKVLRIVARFFATGVDFNETGEIVRIEPFTCFVKYSFLPSPDGSFYDMGLGRLLGSISDTCDSLVNQLLDSGTLANLGGGFISRDLVIRTGDYEFTPGEWKIVDSTGKSLKEGLLPLPAPTPSNVLLDLLNILLQYGERIPGTLDILSGESPGQNTPDASYQTMLEQGSMVFKGVLRRTYRAFRRELKLQFELNKLYMQDSKFFGKMSQKVIGISQEDYLNFDGVIFPSADPQLGSDQMRINQARTVEEVAKNHQGFDDRAVVKRLLRALRISDTTELYPEPDPKAQIEPPVDPKIQVAQITTESKERMKERDLEHKAKELNLKSMATEARLLSAEARAIKQIAEAEAAEPGNQLKSMTAMVKALQKDNARLVDQLRKMNVEPDTGNAGSMANQPNNEGVGGALTPEGGFSGIGNPSGAAQ